jgi:dGTPase
VRFTAGTRQTSLELKRFLLRNVYSSDALDKNRCDSIAKLDHLFEYLLAHPEKIRATGNSPEQSPRRAVCDFLAGMTDRYCLRFYDTVFQSSTLE